MEAATQWSGCLASCPWQNALPPADSHSPTHACYAPQADPGDTLFEFFVDGRDGAWRHWQERVPAWSYPEDDRAVQFASLLIPTLDTARYEALLSNVHSGGKASLLVGGPGACPARVACIVYCRPSPIIVCLLLFCARPNSRVSPTSALPQLQARPRLAR